MEVEKEVITRIGEINITIIKLRNLLLPKVVLDLLRLLDLIRRLPRRAVCRVESQFLKSPPHLPNNLNKIERPTLELNLLNHLKPTLLNLSLALTLQLHRSLLFAVLLSHLLPPPLNFLLPLMPHDLELKAPILLPLPYIANSTNNLNQLLHYLVKLLSNLLVLRHLTHRIDLDLHHLEVFTNLSRSIVMKTRTMELDLMELQKRLRLSIRLLSQQPKLVGVRR